MLSLLLLLLLHHLCSLSLVVFCLETAIASQERMRCEKHLQLFALSLQETGVAYISLTNTLDL